MHGPNIKGNIPQYTKTYLWIKNLITTKYKNKLLRMQVNGMFATGKQQIFILEHI